MELSLQANRDRIEIKVPCKAEYVRTVRRTAADFANAYNLPKSQVEEIEVAISEAVSNVVRHAYIDCERAPSIRVRCVHHRDALTFEVIDKGRGFAAPADGVVPDVDFGRDGGLGIILIKQMMDAVNYTSRPGEGTRLRMTKRLGPMPERAHTMGGRRLAFMH